MKPTHRISETASSFLHSSSTKGKFYWIIVVGLTQLFSCCSLFHQNTIEEFQSAISNEEVQHIKNYVQENPQFQSHFFQINFEKMSPLEYAIYCKKTKSVEALVKLGANCDVERMIGAFWSVTNSGSYTEASMLETLTVLLEHNPNLIKDSEFCEGMMLGAIHFHSEELLSHLLELGVSPHIIVDDGWTLLDYAIAVSFDEGVTLLNQYGATEHPHVDSSVYPDLDALIKNLESE